MRKTIYTTRGEVLTVFDGDTFHARCDLGFKILYEIKIRLFGINAAEIETEAGREAKQKLAEILPTGTKIIIESQRLDKFGRSQAVVYRAMPNSTTRKEKVSVNQMMIDAGFAVEQFTDL